MRQRQRKLVGTFGLLVLVTGWALVAIALAPGRITALPVVWQLLAFFALGLGWVLPAGVLIVWMLRPDPKRD